MKWRRTENGREASSGPKPGKVMPLSAISMGILGNAFVLGFVPTLEHATEERHFPVDKKKSQGI
jgi:hypothetical protein